MPAVLNSADEVAVDSFLKKKIEFCDIHRVIKKTMTKVKNDVNITLAKILSAVKEAEVLAKEIINKGNF